LPFWQILYSPSLTSKPDHGCTKDLDAGRAGKNVIGFAVRVLKTALQDAGL
jgi:hypothetical protein